MSLHDPVAVYVAGSNLEAVQLGEILISAGIEAAAVADESLAGMWMFGYLPQIHRPKVWVERSQQRQAEEVIAEFERSRAAKSDVHEGGGLIAVVCEECGVASSFPATLSGSLQYCPQCRAYVDVGEPVAYEDWESDDEQPRDDET
jgi:hypothetical protein